MYIEYTFLRKNKTEDKFYIKKCQRILTLSNYKTRHVNSTHINLN